VKLVTTQAGQETRAGVVVDDRVFDAQGLLSRPAAVPDVQALFQLGPEVLDDLLRALTAALSGERRSGVPLVERKLCVPVLQPPTIRDFMAYEGHATMGGQWKMPEAFYRLPVFYFSNPLCLYAHGEAVPFPSASRKLDYELEIAAVVCREGRDIAAADAMDYIGGFTIFNDLSARDLQRDEMQCNLGPAKGKDFASCLGPWVVTLDELGPLVRDGQLHSRCTLRVNGVEWVAGTAANMHHDWPALVERASRDSRIVPGDLICAGTIEGGSIPEAIRRGLPARYLQPGDEIVIEVEGIGRLDTVLGERRRSGEGYRYAPPVRA